MTTNDAGAHRLEERDTAGPSPDFDELIAEEEAYTPPPPRDDTTQDAVPVEVLPPSGQPTLDDPTPPAVAPQTAPPDAPGDGRPYVPRDLEGQPTDFEPMRVPVVESVDDLRSDHPVAAQDPVAAPPIAGSADHADHDDAHDGARWQEIQVRFVDDPAAAVGEAAELVEDAVARIRDAHDSTDSGDSTEQLRLAFRRYRAIHELATRPDVP